jgi:hypothetical protein
MTELYWLYERTIGMSDRAVSYRINYTSGRKTEIFVESIRISYYCVMISSLISAVSIRHDANRVYV